MSRAARSPYQFRSVEETAQVFRTGRVPELTQCLGFYLTNTFTRDVKLLADFFQRVVGVHADTKTHAQYLGLALRERLENLRGRMLQALAGRGLRRRQGIGVLDKIAKVRILVVADRRFHRD